jgi:hypothetical protein
MRTQIINMDLNYNRNAKETITSTFTNPQRFISPPVNQNNPLLNPNQMNLQTPNMYSGHNSNNPMNSESKSSIYINDNKIP